MKTLAPVSVALASLALALPAAAQSGGSSQGQPGFQGEPAPRSITGRRPVRRPVIDLEEAARTPRPGQVVPGSRPTAPLGGVSKVEEPVAAPEPAPVTRPQPAAADRQPIVTVEEVAPVVSVSPRGTPVTARILDADSAGSAQWRVNGGGWMPVRPGQEVTGVIEVRTGLTGSATLSLADSGTVHIGRLTNAHLSGPVGAASAVVTLERGVVEVAPGGRDVTNLSTTPIRVATPDGASLERTGVRVAYDVFSGTTRSAR